ncbi:PLP-dependent aminotransferase family protein [Pokkaliibacter sp. CJK22405]|uniref:MocR-like pyridoxine biosynthesis transcription factor PdxR n=1 Tax=Pokkaliibacter sp. CJK22405 TaxID=3384615 RepID=UPI00398526FE
MSDLRIAINREAGTSLVDQIVNAIGRSIREGQLYAGARLPSWNDLSAQLGVARGTVRAAYEQLIDEQLLVSRGSAGTFVTQHPPTTQAFDTQTVRRPLPELFVQPFSEHPRVFQLGIPAQDLFPHKLWSRMASQAAKQSVSRVVSYPDPRGEPALRAEIAAYLSVARGLNCTSQQIIITAGYSGALGLITQALDLKGTTAWVEDPGYPVTKIALSLAGIQRFAVSVDEEGLQVHQGIKACPQARVAVVTPSQQAPLGMTLSLARRRELLEWAAANDRWIIEDDYLSELQLSGRAAPALASQDAHGRVIHVGTFSKTINPGLRLGFAVIPPQLVNHFGDVAASLVPAASVFSQLMLSEFLRQGHYLRHLRKMKRAYRTRSRLLLQSLGAQVVSDSLAGLALLLSLPEGCDDVAIASSALQLELAPGPLSMWYDQPATAPRGLLLGITNISERNIEHCCQPLTELIQAQLERQGLRA